jgi:hypothetical protein
MWWVGSTEGWGQPAGREGGAAWMRWRCGHREGRRGGRNSAEGGGGHAGRLGRADPMTFKYLGDRHVKF